MSEQRARFDYDCSCGAHLRGDVTPGHLVHGLVEMFRTLHRGKGHRVFGTVVYEDAR